MIFHLVKVGNLLLLEQQQFLLLKHFVFTRLRMMLLLKLVELSTQLLLH